MKRVSTPRVFFGGFFLCFFTKKKSFVFWGYWRSLASLVVRAVGEGHTAQSPAQPGQSKAGTTESVRNDVRQLRQWAVRITRPRPLKVASRA